MTLAELVKRQRGLKAMSIRDVAAASGGAFKRNLVWDIEREESVNVTVGTLMGLSLAFKLKPDVVFAAAMETHRKATQT